MGLILRRHNLYLYILSSCWNCTLQLLILFLTCTIFKFSPSFITVTNKSFGMTRPLIITMTIILTSEYYGIIIKLDIYITIWHLLLWSYLPEQSICSSHPGLQEHAPLLQMPRLLQSSLFVHEKTVEERKSIEKGNFC